MKHRLLFLEPSKVGAQHSTLISAYLEAAVEVSDRPVKVMCASSLWSNIREDIKPHLQHSSIPVIDPSARRFLIKIPLEILVTLWTILCKRRDDILLVTCLFSPAMYFVDLICRMLRPKNIYIILHSELEALIDPSLSPKITGYGYWCRRWWADRSRKDVTNFVVIDDFIRNGLLSLGPDKLDPQHIHVLTMPIASPQEKSDKISVAQFSEASPRPRACFIGYRSRMKGFDTFRTLAIKRSDFDWLAIGGGILENITTGEIMRFESAKNFATAIGECDVALFPYEAGYELSMSSSVLDAISGGLHVIASSRGCFRALAEIFGPDMVQCVDGENEWVAALDRWCTMSARPDSKEYSKRIAASRFCQSTLIKQMRALLAPQNS